MTDLLSSDEAVASLRQTCVGFRSSARRVLKAADVTIQTFVFIFLISP